MDTHNSPSGFTYEDTDITGITLILSQYKFTNLTLIWGIICGPLCQKIFWIRGDNSLWRTPIWRKVESTHRFTSVLTEMFSVLSRTWFSSLRVTAWVSGHAQSWLYLPPPRRSLSFIRRRIMEDIKGRILVYSILGCPHCMRAKNTLHSQNLPYTDISLETFPQCRQEVLDRTGKKTVPQIFFNNVHVGGNDDLQKLVNFDIYWLHLWLTFSKFEVIFLSECPVWGTASSR